MLKKKQVRIPTLLALFLLVGIITGGFFLSEESFSLSGLASPPDIVPQNIKVSKITDSSFAVSWITAKKTPGFIKTNDLSFHDVRDLENIPKEYKIHYVEIKNLAPNQEVFYEIVSGGRNFPQENVVLSKKTEPSLALPVYGKLTTKEGTTTSGAIFYIELPDAYLWSHFVYDDENWVVPLAYIKTSDLSKNYCAEDRCTDNLQVKIQIYAEEENSAITAPLKDLRPFQDAIVLGENYNYVKQAPTAIPTIEATPTASLVQGAKTEKKDWIVEILNPEEESHLSFPKPFIRGLGVPGEKVAITLESEKKQTGEARVRDDGTWYWNPKNSLSPGEHTLTIKTKDKNGKTVTLKRIFHVLKSGESVLAGATDSATITPSPTRAPTPTTTIPTPTPTLPPSGVFAPSAILVGMGTILLLVGLTIL